MDPAGWRIDCWAGRSFVLPAGRINDAAVGDPVTIAQHLEEAGKRLGNEPGGQPPELERGTGIRRGGRPLNRTTIQTQRGGPQLGPPRRHQATPREEKRSQSHTDQPKSYLPAQSTLPQSRPQSNVADAGATVSTPEETADTPLSAPCPIISIPPTAPTKIKAAIMAYSIAVAPHLSAKKPITFRIMRHSAMPNKILTGSNKLSSIIYIF
ncbi:MAG TPA: hypothetical protein VF987_08955 [Rhodospirillales bacterium]